MYLISRNKIILDRNSPFLAGNGCFRTVPIALIDCLIVNCTKRHVKSPRGSHCSLSQHVPTFTSVKGSESHPQACRRRQIGDTRGSGESLVISGYRLENRYFATLTETFEVNGRRPLFAFTLAVGVTPGRGRLRDATRLAATRWSGRRRSRPAETRRRHSSEFTPNHENPPTRLETDGIVDCRCTLSELRNSRHPAVCPRLR